MKTEDFGVVIFIFFPAQRLKLIATLAIIGTLFLILSVNSFFKQGPFFCQWLWKK